MWWIPFGWNQPHDQSMIENDVGPTWNQIIALVGATSALVFAIGYTLRPIEEIHDDRHDSGSEREY